MSKKQVNPKFKAVAKLLRFVNKADEVFVETNFHGQEHNQMIKNPIMDFGSKTNAIYIYSAEEEFGDYRLELKNVSEIVDWNEFGDQFSYRFVIDENNYISINNEW
jgi:hypothetical protein